MFFDFLLDQTLYAVEGVEVTTKDGTWTLVDTILFVLEGDRRIQVLIDIDTQVRQLVESDKITIIGDIDDIDIDTQVKRVPSVSWYAGYDLSGTTSHAPGATARRSEEGLSRCRISLLSRAPSDPPSDRT
jgi:hypothetical protein